MDNSNHYSWRPSASMHLLQRRAATLRQIREFFWRRNVTEVDTPALMEATVTDPYMVALSVTMTQKQLFLQTSPEFAMKRLLAAGSGDIYQLGKSYRSDEVGKKHQPEFTLLEWYRLGWDHHQLMSEVAELVNDVCGIQESITLTYQQIFLKYLGIDPLIIVDSELADFASRELGDIPADLFRDDYLSLLFAERIEQKLPNDVLVFVIDFPASQASLARLNPDGNHTSARFEAYCGGLELANGFWELTDASQQRERFERDNRQRLNAGLKVVAIDEKFLAALEHGLPSCSGVALGVDRLLMLQLKALDINDVLSFPIIRESK